MPAPLIVDVTRCPLCGAGNGCAVELAHRSGVPQPPCWCQGATFPDALLARVPDAARGQACICARCAAAATPAHIATETPEPPTPCPP